MKFVVALLSSHKQKTERITIHWHVHKSSLPEEESEGDLCETRARDPRVTSRARYHCATPAARANNGELICSFDSC